MTQINVSGNATASVVVNDSGAAAVTVSDRATTTVQVGATAPLVTIGTATGLTINGDAGNDALTVKGTAGNDTVVLTPGSEEDSGIVAIDNLPTVTFQNLGLDGSLAINGNGGTDALIYNGTALDDSFTVANTTGTISLNGQLPVATTGIVTLALEGLTGNDSFTIGNSTPYTSTLLYGGEGTNTATLTGNGTAVTVGSFGDASTNVVGVTGGSLGDVAVSGIASLTVNAGAGDITVGGTTGLNNYDVTPTAAHTATITDNGAMTTLYTNNTGSLTVDGGAGNVNTITVEANGRNSQFQWDLTAGTLQVDNLKVVACADEASLTVNGQGGTDSLAIADASGAESYTYTAPVIGQAPTFAVGTLPMSLINVQSISLIAAGGAGADSVTLNGAGDNDVFTVSGIATAAATVQVDDGPTLTFTNLGSAANITLNDSAGDDTFNVTPGTLEISGNITVTGSAASGDNTLVINGTTGQDSVTYAPTATVIGAGAFSGLSSEVDFTGIAQVDYNAQGGGDVITVSASDRHRRDRHPGRRLQFRQREHDRQRQPPHAELLGTWHLWTQRRLPGVRQHRSATSRTTAPPAAARSTFWRPASRRARSRLADHTTVYTDSNVARLYLGGGDGPNDFTVTAAGFGLTYTSALDLIGGSGQNNVAVLDGDIGLNMTVGSLVRSAARLSRSAAPA